MRNEAQERCIIETREYKVELTDIWRLPGDFCMLDTWIFQVLEPAQTDPLELRRTTETARGPRGIGTKWASALLGRKLPHTRELNLAELVGCRAIAVVETERLANGLERQIVAKLKPIEPRDRTPRRSRRKTT